MWGKCTVRGKKGQIAVAGGSREGVFWAVKPNRPCGVWVVPTAPTDLPKGSRAGIDDLSPQNHVGEVHKEGEKGP